MVAPAVALFLARTTVGKSMRAVADNRDLAAVSGIDVERMGTYVWLLAGALCGIGGIMFAAVQGTFDPNLGFQVLFLIFTTVVLGGIGSAYGALVGGFVLGLAMELSTWDGFFGGLEARFKPVLAFVALIGLLLYRPQGLFGKARVPVDGFRQPGLLDLRGGDRRHLRDHGARAVRAVLAGRAAEFRPCRVHGGRRLHHGDPGRALRMAAGARRAGPASSPPSPLP